VYNEIEFDSAGTFGNNSLINKRNEYLYKRVTFCVLCGLNMRAEKFF